MEGDRLGRRRPDADGGHPAVPLYAQRAVIGVQVVQHPGNLESGGVHREPVAVQGRDGNLALQNVGHLGQAVAGNLERREIGEVGELGLDAIAQRACGQHDLGAAGDAVVGGLQTTVGCIVQLVGQAGIACYAPGDGAFVDPVGTLLVDVAGVGPPFGQDRQDVGILRIRALRLPDLVAVGVKDQGLIWAGVLFIAAVQDIANLLRVLQ